MDPPEDSDFSQQENDQHSRRKVENYSPPPAVAFVKPGRLPDYKDQVRPAGFERRENTASLPQAQIVDAVEVEDGSPEDPTIVRRVIEQLALQQLALRKHIVWAGAFVFVAVAVAVIIAVVMVVDGGESSSGLSPANSSYTTPPPTPLSSSDKSTPTRTTTPTVSPVSTPVGDNPETSAPATVPQGRTPAPTKASAPQTLAPIPFTLRKPFHNITTTPMDPYVPGDCFFGDNVQPHVINQCECSQSINLNLIANDVVALYNQVRDSVNNEIYGGRFNEPATSCDPINQALYWLSSGDTRDAGDLYQRFVLAVMFIKMNGTDWNRRQRWLSDDSECSWDGLQCDSNSMVINFSLDNNRVYGSIPTEISYLSGLGTLSLSRNFLTGTIPAELGLLTRLENLLLQDNNLSGTMPSEVCSLRSLQLSSLVVDCPSINFPVIGVVCELGPCCTACGR